MMHGQRNIKRFFVLLLTEAQTDGLSELIY